MRRYLIPIALFFVALPAMADAPRTQYEQFDSNSTTIHDQKTGLVWDRYLVKKDTYANLTASAYCPSSVFTQAGGRIPTIKELFSLFDEDGALDYDIEADPAKGYIEYKYIDSQAFPETKVAAPYWSSTEPSGDTSKVWVLDFSNGKMSLRNKSDTAAVRCVRMSN